MVVGGRGRRGPCSTLTGPPAYVEAEEGLEQGRSSGGNLERDASLGLEAGPLTKMLGSPNQHLERCLANFVIAIQLRCRAVRHRAWV